MKKIESTPTDQRDKPKEDVQVVTCGSLPVDKPFLVKAE